VNAFAIAVDFTLREPWLLAAAAAVGVVAVLARRRTPPPLRCAPAAFLAGAPPLPRVALGREGEAAFDESRVRGAVVRLNGGDDLLYVAHCDEEGGPPSRDLASASSACP